MISAEPCGPQRVVIEPTYACSLHCRHCYVQRSAEASRREEILGKVLPFAFWAHLVETLPTDTWIHFTGGEIFEYPGAIDLIGIAAAQRRVSLITNGQKLTGAACRELEKCAPRNVTVSILGDANVHDRITGVPGSHQAAIAALQRLLKRLPPDTVSVNFTLLEENSGVLPQVASTLAAIGLRTLVVQSYDPALTRAGIAAGATIDITERRRRPEQNEDQLRVALDALHREHTMTIVLPTLPDRLGRMSDEAIEASTWQCAEIMDTMRCGAQGQVYTCTGSVMGRLDKQSWKDIWESESFVTFRRRKRVSSACAGCCKLRTAGRSPLGTDDE